MHRRIYLLLGEVLLAVAVLVTALSVFGGRAWTVAFQNDESKYLNRARYFGYLFLEHDVTRPDWGDNLATHTQPMLANYLLGAWFWARGYDVYTLSPGYDPKRSFEENRLRGGVPEQPFLGQARLPMVATAAGAAALLYVLGRVLGGPLAGLAAAALMLGSPLLNLRLVRARADSPLAFFLVLALLLAVLGARRGRAGRLPLRWAIAVGVALGLGLGSKLTAALGVGAVLTWGGLVVALAVLRGDLPHSESRLARAWAVGRGWVLAVVVGLGVFVLTDPHLYPNPPLHGFHLFQERYEDLVEQQQAFSRRALRTPLARVRFVLDGSLISGTATGDRGLPIEALLAPLGGAALLVRAWRGWRRQAQVSADGLVLVTVLVYYAGVSAAILWAVETYLVPTLLLGTLLSGLGMAAAVGQLPHLVARIADTGRLRPISPPASLRWLTSSRASDSQGVMRSGLSAPETGQPALREAEGSAISGNN